jgi:hypothetical protein
MLILLLEQTLQLPHLVRCSDRSLRVGVRRKVDIEKEALESQSLRVPHCFVSSVPRRTVGVSLQP